MAGSARGRLLCLRRGTLLLLDAAVDVKFLRVWLFLGGTFGVGRFGIGSSSCSVKVSKKLLLPPSFTAFVRLRAHRFLLGTGGAFVVGGLRPVSDVTFTDFNYETHPQYENQKGWSIKSTKRHKNKQNEQDAKEIQNNHEQISKQ